MTSRGNRTVTLSFGACVWLLAGCSAGTPAGPAPADFGSPDQPDTAKAVLVWQDEFDDEALDTTKWRHRHLGERRDAYNVRDAVALDGKGNLLITTSRVDGAYHTGMIGTQETFQRRFGYYEARIKFQKQQGHWAAFWLQSPDIDKVGNTLVNGTEVDVIEYMANRPDTAFTTLHWDGYGSDHKSVSTKRLVPGLSEGYHTVAVEWTPTAWTFFIDGEEVWRTAQAPSNRQQYMILSLEVADWAGDIGTAVLPDTLYVDYVRVYDKRPG